MADIAFLITTWRSVDWLDINTKIVAINSFPNPNNYSYKFYVAAPKELRGQRLSNVEFVKDKGTGSAAAFNLLAKKSEEDFIIVLTDVSNPPENIFDMVSHLESLPFKLSSFTVAGGKCSAPHEEAKGAMILRWPCIGRFELDNYLEGVLFNESFKHHFVDNWIGAWTTLEGFPCTESDITIGISPHASRGEDDEYDSKIFKLLLEDYASNKNRNYNNLIVLDDEYNRIKKEPLG